MLTQNKRKVPYVIVLILIIILTLVHLALAGTNDRYFEHHKFFPYEEQVSNSVVAFIVVLAIASLLIAVLLLVDAFCNFLKNRKLRHILITILLILQFALAVIAAFLATFAQRRRQHYKDSLVAIPQKLDQFYFVAIASAVLTFILTLPLLALAFYNSMDQLAYSAPGYGDQAPGLPGSATRF